MKHLLTTIICLCFIAIVLPPASATLYWNFSAGINAGYPNGTFYNGTTISVDYGPVGIDSIANQTCMVTGRRFWFIEWQTTGLRAFNQGTYYSTSDTSDLLNASVNYTNPANLTVRLACSNDGTNVHQVYMAYYTYGGEPVPVAADFNATPKSGIGPLYVAFQSNSTGGTGTKTYNWSVSPDTGVVGEESTSAYPTIAFTQDGNYSVTHCVSDSGGTSDCETKTDYIYVYNSTATVTTYFWAVDPLGHRVYDSAIMLKDVENSSWTNTSSPSSGVATITSLLGHIINGYATAAGYNDGETLGITADGVSGGIILMTPTNITNVSTGYVTLYVYAKESVGNAPISGAYINLAYEEGGSTRNDGSTTNTEGIASFVVPNNTLVYVYGEKAGYERVSTTKDSGSGSGGDAAVSVILYMTGQYVTPTVTATTGPGGTVPVTVDPRTPQEKESDIALILIDYGDMLVMFFIALTVIGGVKMIMK